MKNKKSFVLYSDLIYTVKKMPKEKAGELLLIILEYVNDLDPQVEDLTVDLVFEPIKQQLKRDLLKYEDKKKQWSEAGKKSAESRAKKRSTDSTNVKSRSTDSTVSVNDSVTVNVNDNVNDINKRKEEFKNSLLPHLDEFGKETLRDFFSYWSEHGLKDRKMRFEKERSFGITRRLSTWVKNQEKFNSKTNNTQSQVERVINLNEEAKELAKNYKFDDE